MMLFSLLDAMCCQAGPCFQRPAAPVVLLLELSVCAQALSNQHLFWIFTVWSVSGKAEVGLFA